MGGCAVKRVCTKTSIFFVFAPLAMFPSYRRLDTSTEPKFNTERAARFGWPSWYLARKNGYMQGIALSVPFATATAPGGITAPKRRSSGEFSPWASLSPSRRAPRLYNSIIPPRRLTAPGKTSPPGSPCKTVTIQALEPPKNFLHSPLIYANISLVSAPSAPYSSHILHTKFTWKGLNAVLKCGIIAHRPTGPQAHRPTGPQAHRPTGPQAHRPTGPQADNSAVFVLFKKNIPGLTGGFPLLTGGNRLFSFSNPCNGGERI